MQDYTDYGTYGGRVMDFDKSRVFTVLNAEELNVGTRVLVADNLDVLKQKVNAYDKEDDEHEATEPATIVKILDEDKCKRFKVRFDEVDREYEYALVYVIPCTERPFHNLAELVDYWDIHYQKEKRPPFTLPFIWVVNQATNEHVLITGFHKERNLVHITGDWVTLDFMFNVYKFEDGRPFGVVIK